MNKILFALFASLVLFTSCKEDEPEGSFLNQYPAKTIGADQTELTMWVNNTDSWKFAIPEDVESWMSFTEVIVANAADTVKMKFTVNKDVADRVAVASITDLTTDQMRNVTITQKGQGARFYFSPALISGESAEGIVDATLSLNSSSYTLKSKPDWITNIEITEIDDANPFKRDVKITFAENENIDFREGEVIYDVEWASIETKEEYILEVVQLGTGSEESDKTNLTAIYNSLGGTTWNEDYRWDLTKDISTWKGVTLADVGNGAKQRVIGLQLNNVGLSGNIPSEILNLSYLKILWLNDNANLKGSIPANIGDLELMENMRLDNTSITGSIPSSIVNMTSMFSLVISNTGENGITGAIPEGIGSMTNLVTLDLSDNDLSGVLPSSIGSLETLTNIDLSNNELSGEIPSTYLKNYNWLYWNIEETVCSQRGIGFTNCVQ